MSKLNTPFRYDYVGSFLRPEVLKKSSEAASGNITGNTSGAAIQKRRQRRRLQWVMAVVREDRKSVV